MRIIQISDSHIAHDIPQRLVDLNTCIDSINKLSSAPDIVIHTGDIAHNGLEEEYIAARKSLVKLKTPYYILAGNKDNRNQMKQVFNDQSYLQQHPKFIQYSIEQFTTRVLILDTLSDSSNKGELCDERLSHLEQMIAYDMNKPAVVFMHHSPFEVKEIPDPLQFDNWSQVDALDKLLSSHSNVQGVYCGHVHRNVEGTIGKLSVKVLSCMATDLRKGKLSDHDKTRPMFTELEFN